jgi:hypothetical protein
MGCPLQPIIRVSTLLRQPAPFETMGCKGQPTLRADDVRPPMEKTMSPDFKIGDHVAWNSEAGHVSGRIIKVHTQNVDYKGHTNHASKDEPQYEIKSDKTDHIAMHKGSALRKTSK